MKCLLLVLMMQSLWLVGGSIIKHSLLAKNTKPAYHNEHIQDSFSNLAP